jgi:GT2 family glycosyltransferase
MGANLAQGDIHVFLDDDSYPSHNLLSVASHFFSNPEIVAIGGPATTPTSDTFWQKVSGAVFLSKFSGGNPERYIPIGIIKEVEDWPSVNFMVRKDAFIDIGGFNSPYWPGEDTKLCLDLIERTGKKILYVPSLMVWHHRREGLIAHLRQIGAYGLHRGYFAKVHPRTSRKITYLIPSIFTIFLLLSIFIGIYPQIIRDVFLIGWVIYSLALIKAYFDIRRYESCAVALVSLPYIVATHFWYGIRFIEGVFTGKLVSQLR